MEQIQDNIILAIGVLTPIVMFLVTPIKKIETLDNRFLPYISMSIGVVAGIVFSLMFNQEIPVYSVAGLIAGATASGFYDAFSIKKGDK